MERLAYYVVHHRRLVIGAWILLTAFGAFSAGKVSDRWLEDFSIPGAPGYEADQRALAKLGNGELFPARDRLPCRRGRDEGAGRRGRRSRRSSRPTPALASARSSTRVTTSTCRTTARSRSRTSTRPGEFSFEGVSLEPTEKALAAAVPNGVEGWVTGIDALYAESSETEAGSEPPSMLVEAMIGGLGALVILLFTFGTLPAIAMPLLVAIASILNTFTLIWLLTYITDVSIIVQFLVALVGLGVAIDYALLMIFRFREELRHGADRDQAIAQTMKHAGRSVIVSGSTVAVGLLSMIILPLPFIRSIGIGGMLIPAVSVLTAITLLPALLYTLGPRINSVRVMPRRIVEGSDDPEKGFWNRWAHLVVRRPVPVAAVGLAIVAVLLYYGVQLNPGDAQAKDLPGGGDCAHEGAEVLRDAGITDGVHKPFQIVVEGDYTPAQLEQVASQLDATEGIAGAAAPPPARAEGLALVEAFSTTDGSSRETQAAIPAAEGRRRAGGRNRAGRAASDARRAADVGVGVHRRRLRQLQVRAAVRRPAHLRAADAGVQVRCCCRSRP